MSAGGRKDQLRYVNDDEPGYRRRRSGRGFVYLDRRDRRITNRAQIERIDALAIPPAWTDVWICPDAQGHLQATGRDAKGRKQYRYHVAWRAQQEQDKYQRMIDFGTALPGIRKQVAADYRRRGVPREKVLAVVVHLLESSLIRVGNDEYAEANGSYGLTTLRDRHVRFDAGDVRFSFAGKSGKDHTVTVHDARTARVCPPLPRPPGSAAVPVPRRGREAALGRVDGRERVPPRGAADRTSPPRTSARGSARCSPRSRSTRSTSRARTPRLGATRRWRSPPCRSGSATRRRSRAAPTCIPTSSTSISPAISARSGTGGPHVTVGTCWPRRSASSTCSRRRTAVSTGGRRRRPQPPDATRSGLARPLLGGVARRQTGHVGEPHRNARASRPRCTSTGSTTKQT